MTQAQGAADNVRQKPLPIAVVAALLAILATVLLIRRNKR